MTVLEAIQRSVDFLAKKGVESPRLNAELLLAHALGVPRMKLYLDFDRALTAPEQDQLRELVRRRGQREPLQHITGSTSFWGLELAVTSHVLAPRPETELLAEFGWQFLNTRPTSPAPPAALDFGTGSGCLAIALAAKCSTSEITAIDISPEALAVARQNAARHRVESRVQFFAGNGFAALSGRKLTTPSDLRFAPDAIGVTLSPSDGEREGVRGLSAPAHLLFDLIIANPPYIPTAEIASLEPEVRDHDPRAALDGGADGLDFYRRLAGEAAAFLKPDGRLMLEFGDGQGPVIESLFTQQMWIVEAIKVDYHSKPRVLIARRTE